jgi:LytS/YehU family sensor histidine kinase
VLAAGVFAVSWFLLNSVIESVLRGHAVIVIGVGVGPYLVLGVWIYVMVAGVAYAAAATERAARAEALAARSQLAALRAQLHPHFLFNALHTVVQLIPHEPRRAAQAAELVAALLRTTIEQDRDLVSLGEEWAFVEGYLGVERIRFGDRLRVRVDMPDDARSALIPSFAVQALVENAVRHGAAPREEPTEVSVTARAADGVLTVTVRDTGAGATPEQLSAAGGTGLRRLRERLTVLYAHRARLDVTPGATSGLTASLVLPLEPAD